MTTSKLSIQYERGSANKESKIIVGIYTRPLVHLKMFLLALFGRPQILWHTMTGNDIEGMSNTIVRWRIVRKLRSSRHVGR